MPSFDHSSEFEEIVKHRQPSQFLVREMIYDYLRGFLPASRSAAIEKVIEESDDLKHIKKLINISTGYCQLLGKIQVGENLISELSGSQRPKKTIQKAFVPRHWPIPIRWGAEAFVVSFFVATATLSLFWSKIEEWLPQKQELVIVRKKISLDREGAFTITDPTELAEVHNSLVQQGSQPHLVAEVPKTESKNKSTQDDKLVSKPNATSQTSLDTKSQTQLKATSQTPPIVATQTPPHEKSNTLQVSNGAVSPSSVQASASQPVAAVKPKGYVYKIFMNLPHLETVAAELTQKIVNLGAEKAGAVELGWKKPGGRYYHFILPKENRELLLQVLKSYGPLTEIKDPHVRIVPPDQERYIVWIEGN